jgi:hypothetical protein
VAAFPADADAKLATIAPNRRSLTPRLKPAQFTAGT